MDRKLKIAVWYNLPSGGSKRALYYHVRGLVERGHQVKAWRPPIPDADYLRLDQFIEEREIALRRPVPVAKSVPGRLRELAYLDEWRMLAMEQHAKECAAEINEGGFDLFLGNTCKDFHVPFLARFLRIPSALYLGEPTRMLYESMPRLPWLALPREVLASHSPKAWRRRFKDLIEIRGKRVWAREELINASSFTTILVNSFYSRESVIRAFGLDAKVCYLGIDTNTFRDLQRAREPYVLSVGTFSPSKNVKLVLRAMAHLPQKLPLIWVGNAEVRGYIDEMVELAKTLAVDFRPKLLLPDKELVELLNRAWLMAYAPRLEPFGLAPLEANSCGTPVVGVSEGGIRETVLDGVNGLLVEGDPASLAKGMQLLLNDESLARRLGETGARVVREKWTLESSIDRLEQRLTETLSV